MRVRLLSWVSAAGLMLTVAATAQAQKGTATPCKDGTTSTVSGRGACSGHGGVDGEKLAAQKKAANTAKQAAKKSEKTAEKSAKTEAKTEKKEASAATKMVKCTDGAMSKGGRGACSGHGGIAKTPKKK
jgi:hypothetical protein